MRRGVPRRRSRAAGGEALHDRRSAALTAAARLTVALAEDALARGQTVRCLVRGGSMRPTLWDGDVLHVAPISGGCVSRGALVCYAAPTGLIVHRLIRRRGIHVVLRGDAVRATEEIAMTRLVGVVVAVETGGRVRSFETRTRHVWGRMLAVASPLLALCVAALLGMRAIRARA